MRMQNRKALQAFHSDSYGVLAPLLDSPFEADAEGLAFLGRHWSFEPPQPLPSASRSVLFGLPEARQLKALLDSDPQRLLIVDSQPERVWAQMMAFDYAELLAHPALELQINSPEKLLLDFQDKLFQFRDLQGLEWRESQPATELAERMADVFFRQAFRVWQTDLSRAQITEGLADRVNRLYQELLPATETAYAAYPLSCGSGCAQCCHKGVGSLLMLTPGEWLVLWQVLNEWPQAQQAEFAKQFAGWAQRETELLHTLLHFFDAGMDEVQTSEFSIKHLELIASQQDQACFLLDPETQTCRAYAGRPLTCRLFGVGHFYGNTPYTCDLDWERHEQILLREGRESHLLKAEDWKLALRQLHRHFPYKMPMALWLVSHLDFNNGHWLTSPRLEYAQFQALLEKDALEAHLGRSHLGPKQT